MKNYICTPRNDWRKNLINSSLQLRLKLNKIIYKKIVDILNAKLPVGYCIKMWCKLRIFPRSTLHSAVVPSADIVHFPSKCPSTAQPAPQNLLWNLLCCHAGLFNATFSVKFAISLIWWWWLWWWVWRSFSLLICSINNK